MLGFKKSYEVCNCKKVTINQIKDAIINKNALTLSEIQDITTAGTECRFCIFPEGDFGKMKKKIYCKDILNEIKKEMING
ncbi:bacterioferritin-associated ferredoxin [Arcobacter aquimarinus]|uniref:BFD-like [2Fe-2S]-binding domain-containing protein n=1 Tax=Arcobacter aquimarinus TaxID=1315211 RepID=A0AAE7E0L9_9BACT|nr:(2Fe-2S)-binding protein [Arcobacter aquimarinus]QKE26153.1 BFD-like [2Fe-2S]-binding domain-containing protein [Arcobacter aquimarinus]RXI36257.1 (2Fe-2S)-binding protein [Arcobacter aquimarinus]